MKRHIFFDLDRTLWDFERNSEKALNIIFEETSEQHQLPSFYRFLTVYKSINKKLWKAYGKGKITKEVLRASRFYKTFYHFDINNRMLSTYFDHRYLEISPSQKKLFPNTIETLETLKKDGYQLHILTNGFKEVQNHKLENCGIKHFFETVTSSEEVGCNKPAIEIFQFALEVAQAKANESIMIGDDYQVDVVGAENAGMKAIHFAPEMRKASNRIHNLNELPAILPKIFAN